MAVTKIVTRQIADDAITKDKLGILSTKGDLLGFSTEPVRVAIGTDGWVLTADAASTPGFKWAAASGGLGTSNFITNEVPSGTVNGSNATFTLANTPTSGTEQVYVNGIHNKPGASNDYTISSTTITFLTGAVPETGDQILVSYLK